MKSLLWMLMVVASTSAAFGEADPLHQGPSIGISVDNYYGVRIDGSHREGVRVRGWNQRNRPYQVMNNGNRKYFSFRLGQDVILEVNGDRVSTSDDVLEATHHGRNELKIYDMKTRRLDYYQIDLP